jgi:excisionase family DNA binding protein
VKTDEVKVLTVRELAEMLRIGRRQAYELLRDGKVKGVRIGRTWRVSREAVEEFLNGE